MSRNRERYIYSNRIAAATATGVSACGKSRYNNTEETTNYKCIY